MGVAGMHYLGITCIVSYNLIIRLEWGGEQLHYLLSLQWPSLGAKGGSDLSRQCNIYGIVLEHSNREVAIIIQVNDGLHAIEKFVRSPLLPSRVSYFPGVSILLGVPCCCCLAFTLDDGLPGNVSVYICTQLKLGYLLLLFLFFFQVTYLNHKHFGAAQKKPNKPKPSPVRIFTNLSRPGFRLPTSEGYRLCKSCVRYVSRHNCHCSKCDSCTSKVCLMELHELHCFCSSLGWQAVCAL